MTIIIFSLVVLALFSGCASAQNASITVHPEQILTKTLSPYMTGACLEDVNHEVYGGIDSQMIYGESFQEPPCGSAIEGFREYGGVWSVRNGVVSGEESGDHGAKLVADLPDFTDGQINADIKLPKSGGNAGLIVKLKSPGVGADNFTGFEVSLDVEQQQLVLGYHCNNWEPISRTDCHIPADTWVKLTVVMQGDMLNVSLDGKSVVTHHDQRLAAPGGVALRLWEQKPIYRNLSVRTADHVVHIPFEPSKNADISLCSTWQPVMIGNAVGKMWPDAVAQWHGLRSQVVQYVSGSGVIGISNSGLGNKGMNFVQGKTYEGYLRVRVTKPTKLYVQLSDSDGSHTYAQKPITLKPSGWQLVKFSLKPNTSDPSGRFNLLLKQPGEVSFGYAFLQPGKWARYKGLSSRKDVVNGLLQHGVTVLRYGGCMVNTSEYKWKKMIGPRDQRPPYQGFWHPYSSNGWGIIDFLATCKAAGILAIPDFNIDESPQDMVDFLEYANGTADSKWGSQRVADGFRDPFQVKIIELGNEEHVNDDYWRKFKPLAEAMWAKDPNVILVVGDLFYNKPITDPYHHDASIFNNSLEPHKKILDLAAKHHREVWIDVHIGTNAPTEVGDYIGPAVLHNALKKLCPKANFKVPVFELNAARHDVGRMLANAWIIGLMEQQGDIVPVVASANCLQPDGLNDNAWDQGLLFLNPTKVWAQPPFYVTQMLTANALPTVVKADVYSADDGLKVTAKRSANGRTMVLQVVNITDKAITAKVDIDSYVPKRPAAVSCVSGQLSDVNTADNPERVKPTLDTWNYRDGRYTFPAYSFTVIRLE